MKLGTASFWEQDAGRELNAIARETCATVCPFRVDCYMTSYMTGDTGVIRGGIMLQGRVKTTVCVRCGLPAIKVSKRRVRKLCQVCICLWACYGCGRSFWVDRRAEPKSFRQYHSEECRIRSLRGRIIAARAEGQRLYSDRYERREVKELVAA